MMVRGAAGLLMVGLIAACTDAAPLVDPAQIDGDAIPAALSGVSGDAAIGKAVFVEREQGHCVLCHQIDGLETPFQGNVGPALTGLGSRLNKGQIRLRIVNASVLNPSTIMPPYYRIRGLNQVADEHRGAPVLTADQIEHLVAYLSSLKG